MLLGIGVVYVWGSGTSVLQSTEKYPEWRWSASWHPVDCLVWFLARTKELIPYLTALGQTFFSVPYTAFAWLCFLAGTSCSSTKAQEKLIVVLIVVTSLLGAAGAGLLRKWPYGGYRTMLFLIPLLVPFAAVGLCRLVSLLSRERLMTAAALLVAALIVAPCTWSLNATFRRPGSWDMRALLQQIKPHIRPTDVVALTPLTDPEFTYYWEGLSAANRLMTMGRVEDISQTAGSEERLWLVNSSCPRPEFFAAADRLFERESSFSSRGCQAVLYRVRRHDP
jgi:hypothetical protein